MSTVLNFRIRWDRFLFLCVAVCLGLIANALHAAEYRAISLIDSTGTILLGYSGATFSDGISNPAAIVLSSISNTTNISTKLPEELGRSADERLIGRFSSTPQVDIANRMINLSSFTVQYQIASDIPPEGSSFRILCNFASSVSDGCLNTRPDLQGETLISPIFPAEDFSCGGPCYIHVPLISFTDLRGVEPVTYYCSGPCFSYNTTRLFRDEFFSLAGPEEAVPLIVNLDGSFSAKFIARDRVEAGNDFTFNFAPVPEPQAYALLMAGLLALFIRARVLHR